MGGIVGRQNPTKDNGAHSPCHQDSQVLCRLGRGALRGANILQKIMASPLFVIKIVKYCGIRGGGHCRTPKSYKRKGRPLSLSIKIVGKNILLINNIIVYCLSLLPSVLFEKLTATAVLYFTRCHLKTFDNCHVITIHIQYTIFGINFNVD